MLLSLVFEVVVVLVQFVLGVLLVSEGIWHDCKVLLLFGGGGTVVGIAAALSGVRKVKIHAFVVLFAVWIKELVF